MEKILNEILKNKAVTKEFIEECANSIVSGAVDGSESSLALTYKLKVLSSVMESAIEKIKDSTLIEAQKHGVDFKYNNCDIHVGEFGTRYDYSFYPKWKELKASEDVIAKERKKIEDSLKKGIVDEETGEMFVAKKTSKTGLSFSFRKDGDTDESVAADKKKIFG